MARVPPTPITPAPDLPQRSDRSTFASRSDAYVDWQANEMAPGIETLTQQAYDNAVDAYGSAGEAAQSKTDAEEQASLALTRANAAANAAGAASISAGQAADDRVQTGLDRSATAADRVKTGEDRQAVEDMLEEIAGGPVASVNGKPGPTPVLVESDISPLQAVNAATTLAEGKLYGVDTTDGAVTVTLPAEPTPGMLVSLADVMASWGNTPVTLGRNGQNIMGLAEDMSLDVEHVNLDFIFINSSRGWVIA